MGVLVMATGSAMSLCCVDGWDVLCTTDRCALRSLCGRQIQTLARQLILVPGPKTHLIIDMILNS